LGGKGFSAKLNVSLDRIDRIVVSNA
jgi:hypothetical protein